MDAKNTIFTSTEVWFHVDVACVGELDQRISQEYWIPRLTSSSSDILRIPVDSRSRTASHLGPETHHSHVLVSPQSLYAAPVRLVVSFLVPGGLGF